MTFEESPPMSEEEGEALAFLRKGCKLRGLSPDQFRRIEKRLAFPNRPVRTRPWLPVLAAISVALLAGAALAHVMGPSRLPFIGRLFPSHTPSPILKVPRAHPPVATPSGGMDPSASRPASTPLAPSPLAERRATAVPAAGAPTPALARPEKRQASQPSHLASSTSVRSARPGTGVGSSLSLAPSVGTGRSAEANDRAQAREAIAPPSAPESRTPQTMPAPTASIASRQIPVEDPISAESQSFSAALAEWHRDHDAEAALAALDKHERRFPYGQIHLEAKLLRAEILLQQGQEPQALRLLDSVSLSGLPRGRELQTVRGELRVKYGRCREGRSDLEHVLAKERADGLGLRAARALSLCP